MFDALLMYDEGDGQRHEMNIGPFSLTLSNSTSQLSDPTQPNNYFDM